MSTTAHRALTAKIRREIIPAAGELSRRVESWCLTVEEESGDVPEQLRFDAAKLQDEAHAFVRQIEQWFPAQLGNDADSEALLRSARHDARNRLNHLFGVLQLIRITPEGTQFSEAIEVLSHLLEDCLRIVSQQLPESPHVVARPENGSLVGLATDPGGRLLIADDDEDNRTLLGRLLEPRGFELDYAENGEEAITKIEHAVYDAVLLDIQMPVMDGFEVLSRLRESGHLRHTPVIVVTGLQEEQDAVRCIEIGAEDFLSRPIRPALLMARLNASLEKKRLREQVFEQYFTRELARELARNPDPMKMQAREAEVTVLFCDIRGFSSISERLDPARTVDWLSGVMGEFSTSVIDRGGVLVDYTGDELMAMWGAPTEQPDHAELACAAASEIVAKLPLLSEKWEKEIGARTEAGIGVNTGVALVGNVGTHKKFKYGPLGNVVNVASRVQGATKYLKTPVLITGSTWERLRDRRNTRRLGRFRVQNIQQPVELHQLVSRNEEGIWHTLSDHYEDALRHFESGEFRKASAILGEVLVEMPEDGPSLLLASRVVEAMLRDGKEFSPVWDLPGK